MDVDGQGIVCSSDYEDTLMEQDIAFVEETDRKAS